MKIAKRKGVLQATAVLLQLALLLGPVIPISAQVPRQRGKQKASQNKQDDGKPGSSALAQPICQPVFVQENAIREQYTDPRKEEPSWWKQVFGPATISNWMLVLVGIGAGAIAWRTLRWIGRQADLLERQIASAERSAQQQLRAYVHVDKAYVTFDEEGRPVAVVSFTNVGQTPAYQVRSWAATATEAHPLQASLEDRPTKLAGAQGSLIAGQYLHYRAKWHGDVPQDFGSLEATGFI